MISSNIASTAAGSATSQRTKLASPPAAAMPATVSSPDWPLTSLTTTWAPRAAKAREVARPIPEPAPVTSAILPAKSFMLSLPIADARMSGGGLPALARDRQRHLLDAVNEIVTDEFDLALEEDRRGTAQ